MSDEHRTFIARIGERGGPALAAPSHASPFFVWKDLFAIGAPGIDEEHQRFFALANHLYASLASGGDPEVTKEALLGMAEHARRHFETEETCLIAALCPYVTEHRNQHRNFVLALAHLRGQAMPSAEATFCLARDLILDHILGMDREHSAWMVLPPGTAT